MATDTETHPRPSFLVVDDDPMVRKLVTRGLESLDPEIILEVEDGLQAQQVLLERPVDVVITDVLMPNMDGRELMRWAQEHCPEPLWVVLSGLDTFDAAVDALHLGAFDFLAKPPEVQRVRVAVRNALDQLGLKRDRERLYREVERSNALLAEKVEQLENLCRMLEEQAEVIRADLERAEVIQRALLPRVPPKIDPWSVETFYRPGSNVGGDYYDIVVLDDRHLGLVVADAAGHGVAAAMLSVLFKHHLVLQDENLRPLAPEVVLSRVNKALHGNMSAPGAFITAAYLLLNRRTGQAQMASAGHPPLIWVNREGASRQLARTGPALGLSADAHYESASLDMRVGDRLLLYTDGILEGGPHSPDKDELATTLSASNAERGEILRGFFDAAMRDGRPDRDDVTMILLERSEGVSRFNTAERDIRRSAAPILPAAPMAAPAQMLQGTEKSCGFLTIAGTGTWARSGAFLDAANRMLSRRKIKTLIIDLGACEYLDSTFLGTLYEITASHPEAVRLQRVPAKIRAQFEELDMYAVITHSSMITEDLPEHMEPLANSEHSEADHGQRMLRAHELLASLSSENQEQFRSVVESLRADLVK